MNWVDTTVFTTRFCKKIRGFLAGDGGRMAGVKHKPNNKPGSLPTMPRRWALACKVTTAQSMALFTLVWLLVFALPTAQAADPAPTDISNLRVQRLEEGLFLSVAINFELPSVVEDAMLKGVPITFVAEAEVLRDRWYWYDKRVATASRSVRLAYQPLTRRWRVNVTSGTFTSAGTGFALAQNFDTLGDALSSVRRIARWKIADPGEVDVDARHNIDFRFKLDLSQLPRPLQIGALGQADWNINAERNVRPEVIKP